MQPKNPIAVYTQRRAKVKGDAWLLGPSGSLVDEEKRALAAVVRERQALADGLARYLSALGLERAKPEPRSLAAYLRERYGAGGDDHGGDERREASR